MKLHSAFASILLAAVAISSPAQQSPVLTPDQAAAETAKFLKDLVQLDTSDPPGNESKVASYIAAVDAYGIRVPRTFEENTGVHGNDERIELKYVALYQQLVEEAIRDLTR